jgi:predicted signal transduction protein with EAL and GGDEF domain
MIRTVDSNEAFIGLIEADDRDELTQGLMPHQQFGISARPGLAVKLQASFGFATFPDHATDLTGLLASADRALFGVKANGKSAIGWADMPIF